MQTVLLVPGTATTPDTAFSWNHQPALEAMGWPYCTVELPESAMADAQVSAEYIVHAIRQMARVSGRRVAVKTYEHTVEAPPGAGPDELRERQMMHDTHIANEVRTPRARRAHLP